MTGRIIFKLLLFFIVSLTLWSEELILSLSGRRTSVAKPVTLEAEYSGEENIDRPDIPSGGNYNLEFRGKTRNSSITIVNGKTVTKSSLIFKWSLTPLEEGVIDIGPVSVKSGNKTLTSNSVRLVVDEAGKVSGYELELNTERGYAYAGEGLPCEIVFYISGRVASLRFSIPFMDDIRVESVEPDSNSSDIRVLNIQNREFYSIVGSEYLNNTQYTTLTIPVNLYFDRAGEFDLGKVYLSFNEENGRDYFERPLYEARSISSNSLKIDVKELPQAVKDSSNGVLFSKGKLDLMIDINPGTIQVGDPVELTIEMDNISNPDSVSIPPVDNFIDFGGRFNPLSDPRSVEVNGDSRITIKKKIRFTGGESSFPEQRITYLNLENRKVEYSETYPVPLNILGDSSVTSDNIQTLGESDSTSDKDREINIAASEIFPPVIESEKAAGRSFLYNTDNMYSWALAALLFPYILTAVYLLISLLKKTGGKETYSYPWEKDNPEGPINSFNNWIKTSRKEHDPSIDKMVNDWERRIYGEGEDPGVIKREMTRFAEENL